MKNAYLHTGFTIVKVEVGRLHAEALDTILFILYTAYDKGTSWRIIQGNNETYCLQK